MTANGIIGGRYQIQDRLGAGGMGVVYRGVDQQTGTAVALKLLKPEILTQDKSLVERFQREADALAQLNHPNIVKVLATITEADQHYIVMEYMQNGSLYDLLKAAESEHKPLSIKHVLSIALDVCDALTRTHRLNIIHRDIKPANILIADDNTPRLTDFGLALMETIDRVTNTGAMMGTPDYLPPEVLSNQTADARADIWAFGVMLFEMMAGQRPFSGNNLAAMLMSIMSDPVPDLEEIRPDAPLALVDLIYRMLAKDPNERISSVRIIGAELEAIMRGELPSSSGVRRDAPIEKHHFETPLPTTDAPKHNLPAQTTPFVGREAEVTELTKLLNSTQVRLVTILAPGGMGKTRLSLEVAEQFTQVDSSMSTPRGQGFADGVFFVSLAPFRAVEHIITAIAEATGCIFQKDGRDLLKQLMDYVSDKSLLLVLDNYEHLIEGAGIVSEILQAAPHVKVMVTSRERLALNGETLFNLGGMDFPDWESPEDALEYSAVKLFMQGAKRAQPSFELHADDLNYVARICRMTVGMPLGIVLAAAWVEMLSVKEIAEEIGKSLDFLATEMRDVPERHRSIEAVFEYSWNLLTAEDQAAFRKLSVFRGGFTREAAQEITGASLRTLMALVNKSLLRRKPESGRYEIHELLRQYARKHLEAAGEITQVRDAHARYFGDFLQQRLPDLMGQRQIGALDEIEADFENIRSAWAWALEQKHIEIIDQGIDTVRMYCDLRAKSTDGLDLLRQAHEAFPVNSDSRLSAKFTIRYLWFELVTYFRVDPIIGEQIDECIALARSANDLEEIAFCLMTKGSYSANNSDWSAAYPYSVETVALYRQLNMPYYLADALTWLGLQSDDIDQKYALLNESAEIARKSGAFSTLGWALVHIATHVHIIKNQYDLAEATVREALQIQRTMNNKVAMLYTLQSLSWITLFNGDFDNTLASANELMKIAVSLKNLPYVRSAKSFWGGIVIVQSEDYQQGKLWCEEAVGIRDGLNWGYTIFNGSLGLAIAHIVQGDYPAARNTLKKLIEYFITSGYDATILRCTCLAVGVLVIAQEGNKEYAAELLGLLLMHPACPHGFLNNWKLFQREVAKLKADMGEDVYNAAFERGKSLDLETTTNTLFES